MEALPPSYEAATTVNVWDLIAEYASPHDLYNCALVCSKWHASFAPAIWAKPASHCGRDGFAAHHVLKRFIDTLQVARLQVRSLTHVLHFPFLDGDGHEELPARWLSLVLQGLPNLQCLVVEGSPFFDYTALTSLRYGNHVFDFHEPSSSDGSGAKVERHERAQLRLLQAQGCRNATPQGLVSSFDEFGSLTYLDLSYTKQARSHIVLSGLQRFRNLFVLKLRGLDLGDEEIAILSKSINLSVKSLDLRENCITAVGITALARDCLDNRGDNLSSGNRLNRLNADALEIYRGERFDEYLHGTLTNAYVNRLLIDDFPFNGVTHLYLGDNLLSPDALPALLSSNTLHVLDVGTIEETSKRLSSASRSERPSGKSPWQKAPIDWHLASKLRYLRVDHDSFWSVCIPEDGNIPFQRQRISEPREPPSYDRSEDSAEGSHLPAAGNKSDSNPDSRIVSVHDQVISNHNGVTKRPEVSANPISNAGEQFSSPVASTSGNLDSRAPLNETSHKGHTRLPEDPAEQQQAPPSGHSQALPPPLPPYLATLILTNVPPLSDSRDTATNIIHLIEHFAHFSSAARSDAQNDYTLPPNQQGLASALKRAAREKFALQRLVLEMGPARASDMKQEPAKGKSRQMNSVTEDVDSDALYTAAESDFSFFGDEKPSMTMAEEGFESASGVEGFGEQREIFDTISILSAFRKNRQAEHERRLALEGRGRGDLCTSGYWDGVVQVVHYRPSKGRAT